MRIRIGFLWRPSCAQGELLDQLLQRADPARQRHEGVRALEHDALSFVHVAGDDAFLRPHQHVLAIDQEIRNHAGHGPAVVENRIRQRAHQADRPSAIDQPDAVLGQNSSKRPGRLDESRIGAGTGGAIDANGFDSAHGQMDVARARQPSSARVHCSRREVRPTAEAPAAWGDCSLEKLYMKGIDGLPLPAARQPGPG